MARKPIGRARRVVVIVFGLGLASAVAGAALVSVPAGAAATATVAAPPVSPAAALTVTVSEARSSGAVGAEVELSGSYPTGVCGPMVFASSTPGGPAEAFAVPASPFRTEYTIPPSLRGYGPRPGGAVVAGTYSFSMTCNATSNPVNAVTASVAFTVTGGAATARQFAGIASSAGGGGYWLVQPAGGVYSFGDARYLGSLPGRHVQPRAPIVGIASTPGAGYWLVGADGGVYAFGDATFHGSLPARHLVPATSIVGITATPSGGGYWLVASDGAVFAFGDAVYRGSVTADPAAAASARAHPIVALEVANGGGYYEIDDAGTVWAYGATHNSHGAHIASFDCGCTPRAPVRAAAVTVDGTGVWLAGADGGVFAVPSTGSAPPRFFGSLPSRGIRVAGAIVAATRPPSGDGYWLLGADGGVFGFGTAAFHGAGG